MSFDYTSMQTDITSLLNELGFLITLSSTAGTTCKAYAVWGKIEKSDIEKNVSQTIGESKVLYIAGNIRKVPEVGDNVIEGTSVYSVDIVEPYKPAKTVVAYKVTVSQ